MNCFYKLLTLITLFPLISVAQSNYKPGYVVTAKGDTLRGYIDYREWYTNPDLIKFKMTVADDKIRSFTPADIAFFSVDKLELYERYSGTVSMDLTDADKLVDGRDTAVKAATVFLKVLQTGKRLTAYSYTDAVKTRYFIKKSTDRQPAELIYRVYYSSGIGIKKEVRENTYLKTLYALGQEYNVVDDAFQSDIDHAEYNRQSIIKMVAAINGMSPADYHNQYSHKSNLNFYAGLALSATFLKPGGIYQKWGAKPGTFLYPAISAGFDVPLHPNTGKLLFGLDLTLSGYQYKSAYIFTSSPYVPVRYAFNQLSVTLEPQVIYNFYNEDSFKVFAGLGLALTYYNYYNATYDLDYAGTKVSNAPLNFPEFFNKFSPLLSFKAGINLNKRLELFIDYNSVAPVSKNNYFMVNSQVIQTGAHYFFKKTLKGR